MSLSALQPFMDSLVSEIQQLRSAIGAVQLDADSAGLASDWVAEVRDQKEVSMAKVPGEKNLADLMTKCMSTWKFQRMYKMIQNFQSKIFGE